MDYLNFDDIVDVVLDKEKRRKNKEERQIGSQQVEALAMTRGRSLEHDPSWSESESQNHGMTNKKKGHYKKDCWALKQNPGPQENVANTSDDRSVLVCEATTTNEGRNKLQDVWLLDSGATFYMTSRREWFHQYERISEGLVYTCNDQPLNIVGVGFIKMKMFDGTVRTIQEVRHGKC